MKLLMINPNSSEKMTHTILETARSVASFPEEVFAVSPKSAPESIEGYVDGAFAVPRLLSAAKEGVEDGAQGIAIACFDDTGLDALRSLVDQPVIGIGEASFHIASLVCQRFSVVTAVARSIPVIEENLLRYGLSHRCANVRAAGVRVLDLEEAKTSAVDAILREIEFAIQLDRADAIVLGCAGMADLAKHLADRSGVPVIEGVSAAIKLLEALTELEVSTSKTGGWAPPLDKPYLKTALQPNFK